MSPRALAVNRPDVVVIGCGGGGAVIAKELAEAGLGVVVLEAGPWHDPARDFSGLEWDMLGGPDSVFRWGPADRTKPTWPRLLEGIGVSMQTAGVGGTTLQFAGNCPRAYPESFNRDWPFEYRELVPSYRKVEATLPVGIPDIASERDDVFVHGCEKLGLPQLLGPDVQTAGWRMQPNAILPLARAADPLTYPAADGCTQCGECIVGCRHPSGAPRNRTAKRGTNVTYAPMAIDTGRCEIRTGCFATAILTERSRDGVRARGVRYRDDRGHVLEQDSRVVVLAGGAVESPRLWLASDLPEVPAAGGYLTTHWFDYVSAEFDHEIDMFDGQTSMVRCEFPGLGSIAARGFGPMSFALSSFIGRRHAAPARPFATHGRLWGNALKRKMEAYRRTLVLVVSVDDDALPGNRVALAPALADTHNQAPVIRYRPNAATEARRELLVRKAADILLAAGARGDSLHRADAFPSTEHQHGTLRMGADPSTSVLDAGGEAHRVKRLFGGDTSVFSNGLGGPDPALTAQAIATRTAAKVVERYFS